ncbi:hypothetical protein ACOJQI_10820 [Bacillus salacetis]
MLDHFMDFVIYGLPLIASAAFLFYWGKSGKDWGTTKDDLEDDK